MRTQTECGRPESDTTSGRAAVAFARGRGARAIEGYPMTTRNAILEELHVGTAAVYAGAGLIEIGRPTTRRAVMRLDF
jgi:hypothetical protein